MKTLGRGWAVWTTAPDVLTQFTIDLARPDADCEDVASVGAMRIRGRVGSTLARKPLRDLLRTRQRIALYHSVRAWIWLSESAVASVHD